MQNNLIDDLTEMFKKINEVQEGQDLSCNCKECYWNMWSPNRNFSMICVSESLADFKMTPNSTECSGYWSYEEACGRKKEHE